MKGTHIATAPTAWRSLQSFESDRKYVFFSSTDHVISCHHRNWTFTPWVRSLGAEEFSPALFNNSTGTACGRGCDVTGVGEDDSGDTVQVFCAGELQARFQLSLRTCRRFSVRLSIVKESTDLSIFFKWMLCLWRLMLQQVLLDEFFAINKQVQDLAIIYDSNTRIKCVITDAIKNRHEYPDSSGSFPAAVEFKTPLGEGASASAVLSHHKSSRCPFIVAKM